MRIQNFFKIRITFKKLFDFKFKKIKIYLKKSNYK